MRDLPSREYGDGVAGQDHTLEAAKCIRIISEAESEGTELELSRRVLDDAERIYFWGFGYHPENMKRLRIQKLLRKPTVPFRAGTSSGFEAAEAKTMAMRGGRCEGIRLVDRKILEFMRTYEDFVTTARADKPREP